MLAWTGMATAVGDAARSRRAYVAAVEERARRAEQTREEEARRRVVEERLRIARELHDVVAHHIAVINVQAGVAAHVLRAAARSRPSAALAHVRPAPRHACSTELAVAARRAAPAPTTRDAPPSRPAGWRRLDELLDSLAAAGLAVEHRQHGEPRELPAAVDLAAYRIVQEALTNAHKHGTGTARGSRVRLHGGRRPWRSPTIAGITGAGPAAAARRRRRLGGTVIVGHARARPPSVGGTLHRRARTDGRFRVRRRPAGSPSRR